MPRIPFIFPGRGVNASVNYSEQSPDSSSDCSNVRAYDSLLRRKRGGSRPGLDRWFFDTINGAVRIQQMVKGVESIAISGVGTGQTLSYATGGTPVGVDEFEAVDSTYASEILSIGATTAVSIWRTGAGNWYLSGTAVGGAGVETRKYNSAGSSVWSNSTFGGGSLIYDTVAAMVGVAGPTLTSFHGLQDSDGVQQWSFGAGSSIKHAALAAAGGFAYICCLSNTGYDGAGTARSVFKINMTTGALVASVNTSTGGSANMRIAVSLQGQVVVTQTLGGTGVDNVYVFDENLNLVASEAIEPTATIAGSSTIHPAWDSDNNLWLLFDEGLLTKLNGRTLVAVTGLDRFPMVSTPTAAGQATKLLIDTDNEEVLVLGDARTDWVGFVGSSKNGGRYSYTLTPIAALELGGTAVANVIVDAHLLLNTSVATSREVSLTVVAEGDVFKFTEKVRTPVTSGDDVLVTTPLRVQGASAYSKVFFVDGTNSIYLNLSTDTVATWTATTAGTLPTAARLIARWRGRIVLSGLVADPANWFMSRLGDPFDWDYSPATTDAIQAVAGNVGETGLVGDVVTALIPLDDDLLIIGMDQSIAKVAGDPAAGGAIDTITDQTGMAWNAWALDPNNTLYFMGVDGVYRMTRNEAPINITLDRLDVDFDGINLKTSWVLMEWDFRNRGLVVVVANMAAGIGEQAWFYDARTDGWFPMAWPATMWPDCMLAYDSDNPEDKALLLGSQDGYIRQVDTAATDDDGTAISSNIRFFPVGSRRGTDSRLYGLEVILAEGSGDVTLKLYTGQTAEQCATSTEVRWARTLKAGRNMLTLPRLSGAWLQMEFTATTQWALDSVFGLFEEAGRTRQVKR